MKTLELSRGFEAIVDDEDFEYLRQFVWFARVATTRNIYAARTELNADGSRTLIHMHREIMNAPDGVEVDHRDGDGRNNLRSNLRCATTQQNARNKRKALNATSRFKGVSFETGIGKWRARLHNGVKNFSLGAFVNEVDAAVAYNEAATKFFGEFARLNILPSAVGCGSTSHGVFESEHSEDEDQRQKL